MVKRAKIGVYGDKTRNLQKRISYEATSLTWKTANVFLYLGSRANTTPDIKDIQTTTFMEVPDRAYAKYGIPVNIYFEPLREQAADYGMYGVIDPIGEQQIIKMHVNSSDDLGRSVIEGDVLQIPFFKQDDTEAMWEVIDVDDSQTFEKYYSVLKVKVLEDSRKTREIPITGSNKDTLDDIMNQHEEDSDAIVPNNGVDDEDIDNGETNPDLNEDFDGVTDSRRSFLDELD